MNIAVGSVQGDETQSFMMNQVSTDYRFLNTYDIPLLAGRSLTRDIAGDTLVEGVNSVNVIVNQLALTKLGFSSPTESIGKAFYDFPTSRAPRVYNIVGVTPDQNFLGLHNKIKPMMYLSVPQDFAIGSVRLKTENLSETLADIEKVWKSLIAEYPMQKQFLDEVFNDVFQIYSAMTRVLAGFAIMALTLSMIGLFGLAAFMATSRTKEIGIRKVMGASLVQIVRMLIWQFSKPVIWALALALPLSYLASGIYLNFFAERLELPMAIVLGAGVISVTFAWSIVALHAVKIARTNPIHALRYE
jgi:putative ABC transport system permease protein